MKTIATASVLRWISTLEKQASEVPAIAPGDAMGETKFARAVGDLIRAISEFRVGVEFYLEANAVPPLKRGKRSKRRKH
jgi:hypothetical protein